MAFFTVWQKCIGITTDQYLSSCELYLCIIGKSLFQFQPKIAIYPSFSKMKVQLEIMLQMLDFLGIKMYYVADFWV